MGSFRFEMYSLGREIFRTRFQFERVLPVRTCNVCGVFSWNSIVFRAFKVVRVRSVFFTLLASSLPESYVLNGPVFSGFSKV